VRPFENIRFNSGGGDKKEILDFPVNLSAPVDAPSKTYIEVIKSTAVAMKIVDALKLDVKKPTQHDGLLATIQDDVKTWVRNTVRTARNYFKYGRDIPASSFDLAVENIEKNLVVSAKKDSYAFVISYRSSAPQEAAAVANMAAEIFLEQSAEAYRTESGRARKFIETQLEESRTALDQARAATLAYKNSDETFELTSEYKEYLKNLADLENTLAKEEGKLAGRRVVDQRTQIVSPATIAQVAEIADLKEKIADLRMRLAAYPQKHTLTHSP
jgi:uncharacterized protein involved in exopolysaccharide biosynthesis